MDYINSYYVDEVVLKSMLRADKGLILLKSGVIEGKWRLNSRTFLDDDISKLHQRSRKKCYFILLFMFFIGLLGLSVSKKRKERSSSDLG